MNICEHLTLTAKLLPEQAAVWFRGKSYSYASLERQSAAAAKRLRQAGVSRQDRVALALPNVVEFVPWYYGALRLGAVVVSISPRLAATEAAFIVDDCEAVVVVARNEKIGEWGWNSHRPATLHDVVAIDEESLGNAEHETLDSEHAIAHAEPDDPALILYTSGTTGFPKGATLSHRNVRTNVEAFNHLCGMRSDDRILLAVPLFHCFGQNALLNSGLHSGAALVLQEKFDLEETRRLIIDQQITQLYGVPMMFQMLLERCSTDDMRSVRYCFSAAAPLPIQVSQRWLKKFGLPIHEGYGLTETSPFASYNHRLCYSPGSIGAPIDGVEMRIVDTESGEPVAPGELGEITIRGPNVMLGYWNRPEDTAEAVRDGWFHSGDIGRMDNRGFFYIVDRVKDMIAIGGLKVFPAEVERVLRDHAIVKDAAIVGVPDDVFGEKVVAFVVLDQEGGLPEDAIHAIAGFAEEHLANYKTPREWLIVDALPHNPSGKILKTSLREIVAQQQAEPIHSSSLPASGGDLAVALEKTHASARRQVVVAHVQQWVADLLGSDELPPPETRFLDAGMDSMTLVELSGRVFAELKAAGAESAIPSVQATLVFEHPRVIDLAEFLLHAMQAKSEAESQHAGEKSDESKANERHEAGQAALREQVEAMSEDEALDALLRELES